MKLWEAVQKVAIVHSFPECAGPGSALTYNLREITCRDCLELERGFYLRTGMAPTIIDEILAKLDGK